MVRPIVPIEIVDARVGCSNGVDRLAAGGVGPAALSHVSKLAGPFSFSPIITYMRHKIPGSGPIDPRCPLKREGKAMHGQTPAVRV